MGIFSERSVSMNISGIIYDDVANGEGLRVTIVVSGCEHNCKGCHNKASQDPEYGQEFTEEIQNEIIQYVLDNPFIANPIAKPEKSMIYTVTGMKGNCIETKTVEIKVQPVYNAQIVLSTSDNVKYGAGTRVPVRVIVPSGLNNAEFGAPFTLSH